MVCRRKKVGECGGGGVEVGVWVRGCYFGLLKGVIKMANPVYEGLGVIFGGKGVKNKYLSFIYM